METRNYKMIYSNINTYKTNDINTNNTANKLTIVATKGAEITTVTAVITKQKTIRLKDSKQNNNITVKSRS